MAGLHKAIAQLMEGRQEQRPPVSTDSAPLAQLLGQVRARLPAAEQPLAEAFARELFAKADALLADTGDVGPLAGRALSAFAFFRGRGLAPMAVRVAVPRADRDGWESPLTVVETVLDDHPFILDTLSHTIEAAGGEIRLLLHPVLGVQRKADGTLAHVGPAEGAARRESFVHAEVANLPPSPALEQRIAERLRDVLVANRDYAAMRQRVAALADDLRARPGPAPWGEDVAEASAFLDWIADKNFVYLGYREYEISGLPGGRRAAVRTGSGLGILRDDRRSRYRTPQPLDEGLRARLERPPLLIISKTNAPSPIHRLVPMDDCAVKEVDARGTVIGVRRLVGLFTSKAYGEPASEVPILRRTIATILAREGVVEDSHDYRDLIELFNSIPKEELFASRLEDVQDLMHAIVAAESRAGLHVHCRADAIGRGLFAVVLLPRARFSTELHARVSAVLRRVLHATVLHEHLALDERPVVRLHYYCGVAPDVVARPPRDALEAELGTLLRTWDDELREALGRHAGPAEAERLAARYAPAFPAAYKAATDVAEGARDVRCLAALVASGQAQIELRGGPPGPAALKLYLADEPLVLSEFVPVLECLGLRVLGQDVIEVKLPAAARVSIHTFAVEGASPDVDLSRGAPLLVDALHALRTGRVKSDRLNTLVTAAGLDWRAVDGLRTYVEHGHQIGLGSRTALIDALTANPDCARRLFQCFAAKFDPAIGEPVAAAREAGPVAQTQAEFLTGLDAVESLAHDRVLRALGSALAATVRTNFYGEHAGDQPIAVKLDGARLPHLPAPRPAFETYVHGVGVEGVHLRAGKVARGGIRLSDRPDDFRAEVLGLMHTQVVKNAVIVPVGAKGGFIVKGAPVEAGRAEAAYRLFIEALLSVTDTIESGVVVPPRGQVVYDGPDPYLVVAADKGTATFSDIANEIAERRHFWLGDAFASGGRHGYDHKRLAITARGAWECAREHFRELGRDLDRESVTVIGIGDMSGDVFGNGLLRSRHLCLLAAFNHRHIFLDPDPDPERSFRERERLFHLPRSDWNDYAPAALSPGGGVYPRAAKVVPLSPEARVMLELEGEQPCGEEVVRAILRMKADLLWNGGIGTYVKASDETHADVADPVNDAVRVDAGELRCPVVVEGGNLGLTQRARVEYALGGGRINTDAIDNSGGVDLSDHEVNVKIALQPLVAVHQLTGDARNALLEEVADEVCEAVLAHNRGQALALTLDQVRSRTQLAAFRDLMAILEAEAGLNRSLERLPTREALRARRGAYLGLTRPELAVLLAVTKLDLQRRILQSSLCDDPDLEPSLLAYFPAALAQRLPHAIHQHSLRREITAVEVANRLVDAMGMTFLVRAVRDTGRDVVDIVRAWAAAQAITAAAEVREEIAAARSRVAAAAEQRCWFVLADALERATIWLVETQAPDMALSDLVRQFTGPVGELLAAWPEWSTAERQAAHEAQVAELMALGLEAPLGERLARLTLVDEALEISHLAGALAVPLPLAAEAYCRTAELIDLDWVRRALPAAVPGEGRWEQRAVAGLLEGLRYARRRLTVDVLGHRHAGTPLDECLDAYAAACRDQLDTVQDLITDLKGATQVTLPALLVVMRELGRLVRQP